MAAIPEASIDAIITDPPYCAGGSTEADRIKAPSQGKSTDRESWFLGDAMTTMGLSWLLRQVALEAVRVLKPTGHALMFCDWRMVPALAPAIESAGLRWLGQVVWDKVYPGLGYGFRNQHEMVLHFGRGRRLPRFDLKAGNVIRVGRVLPAKRRHPTEKPLDLMRALIRGATPPDGVVLDPFAGSGSTGEAAILEKRSVVLGERDPTFIAAAKARLREVQRREATA